MPRPTLTIKSLTVEAEQPKQQKKWAPIQLSVSQPVSQSINNQPINQPVNLLSTQSVDKSLNRPSTNRPSQSLFDASRFQTSKQQSNVNQSNNNKSKDPTITNESNNSMKNDSNSQSVKQAKDRSDISDTIQSLASPSVNQPNDHSIDQAKEHSNQSTNQSSSQSNDQSVNQTNQPLEKAKMDRPVIQSHSTERSAGQSTVDLMTSAISQPINQPNVDKDKAINESINQPVGDDIEEIEVIEVIEDDHDELPVRTGTLMSLKPLTQSSSINQPSNQSIKPSDHSSQLPSINQSINQLSVVESIDDDSEEVEIEVIEEDGDDQIPVQIGTLMSLRPIKQPSFMQSTSQSVKSVSQIVNQIDDSDDSDDDIPPVPAGTLLSLKPVGAVRQPLPIQSVNQTVNVSPNQPAKTTLNQSVNQSIIQSVTSHSAVASKEDDKDYIIYLKRIHSVTQSVNQSEKIVAVRLSDLSGSQAAEFPAYQRPNQSINARLASRKTWQKFGDCTGIKPRSVNQFDPISGALINLRAIGLQDTIGDSSVNQSAYQSINQSGNQWTLIGQEFELELRPQIKGAEMASNKLKKSVVTCSKCRGEHLTVHCQSISQSVSESTSQSGNASQSSSEQTVSPSVNHSRSAPSAPTRYVPPSRRSDPSNNQSSAYSPPRLPQARIDGLPACTNESDVRSLCASFGDIVRVSIDRQRRGWAFVTFKSISQARNAADRLDNHRYGGSIIHASFVDQDADQYARPAYSSRPAPEARYTANKPNQPVSKSTNQSINQSTRSVYDDEGRVDDVITDNDVKLVNDRRTAAVVTKRSKIKQDEFVDFGI